MIEVPHRATSHKHGARQANSPYNTVTPGCTPILTSSRIPIRQRWLLLKTKLDCIYYPFSRLLDATTLKHLLLTFDSITFLDEAESPDWRRALLEQMRSDSSAFAAFEELADDYDMLQESGAILIRSPPAIAAKVCHTVAIATIADLEDSNFVSLASAPQRFSLPSRLMRSPNPQYPVAPSWQVFEGKLVKPLRLDSLYLADPRWASHILFEGDSIHSWSLTYQAGCASVLNYYLEAADEMALTPVTSSELHHRLVLQKLKRAASAGSDQSYLDSDVRHRCRAALGQGEILALLGDLFPKEALDSVSFGEIMRFRAETAEQRHEFLVSIDSALRVIDADVSSVSYDRAVALAVQDMGKQLRSVQGELSGVRDRLLPTIGDAVMYGAAGTGALGALATFLGGLQPGGLVAASAVAVGGAMVSKLAKLRADRENVVHSQDSSVSYLLSASKLSQKK